MLTFARVRFVSFVFRPVRAKSLCSMRTATAAQAPNGLERARKQMARSTTEAPNSARGGHFRRAEPLGAQADWKVFDRADTNVGATRWVEGTGFAKLWNIIGWRQ